MKNILILFAVFFLFQCTNSPYEFIESQNNQRFKYNGEFFEFQDENHFIESSKYLTFLNKEDFLEFETEYNFKSIQ